MELKITNDVARWYKNELNVQTHPHVRFYPRYGFGGHIPGFSIGINQDFPNEIYASTIEEGITFFIENQDAWYFESQNLEVILNESMQEPEFLIY